MTVFEKLRWFYRTYGVRALVVRVLQRLLFPSSRTPTKSSERALAFTEADPVGGSSAAPEDAGVFVRYHPALHPLPVYQSPRQGRRVNLVTDRISAGSLFGGVGTAITLAALLARAQEAKLRIVTREEEASRRLVAQILKCNGVEFNDNIDFSFVWHIGAEQLDISAGDRFLTTSWWTTSSVLGSVEADRVHYLLQEDERMFYAYGDQWLRCSEILHRRDLRCIVNTRLLHEHLCQSGLPHMAEQATWFEPAFPESMFHYEGHNRGKKRTLFFYARPGNDRNLFYRGIEALDQAVLEGVIDPDLWDVVFAGHDELPALRLGGLIEPRVLGKMPWDDYAKFIRTVDLGLCLMATPHPSYPPLDLAASGATVLTNRFGLKQDLGEYSENIYCVELDTASLVNGLRETVKRACDDTARLRFYRSHGIQRSWHNAFAGVLDHLVERV